MPVRGIRGAITAGADTADGIFTATRLLLLAIIENNPGLNALDIASVIFTTTDDLTASYPAQAARQIGWEAVPLMCAREIPVPGSLARCIRVLIHWNTSLPQSSIRHVYLGEASQLRPDLTPAAKKIGH